MQGFDQTDWIFFMYFAVQVHTKKHTRIETFPVELKDQLRNRLRTDRPQKIKVSHRRHIGNLGLAWRCHTCLCWCLTWCECFVIKKGGRPFIRHCCPFSPQWGLSYRSLSSPEPWSIFSQTATSLCD